MCPLGSFARTCTLLLLLGVAWLPAGAAAQALPRRPGHPPAFLTGPGAGDPLERALGALRAERARLGLTEADLAEVARVDRYVSRHTGVTHLYLRQRLAGIEVANGDVAASVGPEGRVIALFSRLVRDLRGRVNARRPELDARSALHSALDALDLTPAAPVRLLEAPRGPDRASLLEAPGASLDPVPARLAYLELDDGRVRLTWSLLVRPPGGRHWWSLQVDATTGELLARADRVAHDGYRVWALPLESPEAGPRSLVLDPADPLASPLGWHDTDGVTGPEFTDTRGNNVFAQEDLDANNLGGSRPQDAALLFDLPLDAGADPLAYTDAVTVNLFYWSNLLHDLLYRYGFDEAAGNFQQHNGSAGGLAGDPVLADAQDGSDLSNARFATPPDGSSPRMEMFLWPDAAGPALRVDTPAGIAGLYPGGAAEFGPPLDGAGTSGDLVRALDLSDPNGPTTRDACSPLTNAPAVAGRVALIDRGDCTFVVKVGHAQDAGAIGVVIANNAGDALVTMAGTDPTIVIPSVFIGQSDGAAIDAELAGGVSGTLLDVPRRDSSLDGGVIAHEYAHGLSNRLTGGPSNVSCLADAQPNGMGEGWSDWIALVLTARPGDAAGDSRGIATYLVGQPRSGPGIRNYPYSTDLAASPLTYGDIGLLNQPHGVGEVWAAALWEMYWSLVTAHGFDPDLYAGGGGNTLALQLVVDGLKLQPCNPSFLEGRDAILLADQTLTGGQNQCRIWTAFARRGMGVSADDGGDPNQLGDSNSLTPSEAFDVPAVPCGPSDSDGDGILDDGDLSGVAGDAPCADGETLLCDDSCPLTANVGQDDSGGLLGPISDGIGDACQCADASGGGIVDAADLSAIQLCLAGAGVCRPLCDADGNGLCEALDLVALESALAGGPAPTCVAP